MDRRCGQHECARRRAGKAILQTADMPHQHTRGTLSRVPIRIQQDLVGWAQALDLRKLQVLTTRRGRAPEGLGR